ncbi:50S ribosomal protein L22 [Clostridium niameyense]|uniref:Large ribosomal subunit protein uL22 n=1 Tax=Clostridium niameyense TaxID=1622073 RepID=A0A6M0R8P8_9CLOT|nr:50S ribosomal protein L22 [Clostridium niameyense]NEZ46621.1 50S ribosomal protein L22 [Clostridium niameyense]
MEAKSIVRYVRMSPRKIGVVLDLVRGKDVNEAFAILKYTPKDAAEVVYKALKSAVANAENNLNLDANSLYISEVYACQGPTLKRYQPHAQGRAFGIKKRSSHLTLVVKERV